MAPEHIAAGSFGISSLRPRICLHKLLPTAIAQEGGDVGEGRGACLAALDIAPDAFQCRGANMYVKPREDTFAQEVEVFRRPHLAPQHPLDGGAQHLY